jgi:DNA-nicking Smr family endonuclease
MHDEDDRSAFHEAMRDVTPLKADDRVPLRPPKARRSRTRSGIEADSFERLWTESADHVEATGEDVVFHRRSVPAHLVRRLRAGGFSVAAEIDLHGLTALQAKIALREFIVEAAGRGSGCVRVIHGKGLRSGVQGPVLKGFVQVWLAQWEEVLAFTSARTRDGGSGALYVLLQRR